VIHNHNLNLNLRLTSSPLTQQSSLSSSSQANRSYGPLSPSRTDPLLRRRNPSLPLRPPRNILRRHRRPPQAPGPQRLKIHLQDLRADVPARPLAHPNRLRTAFRLRAPLSHHPRLGHYLPSRLVLYRYRGALLFRDAGLDHGGYYVQQHDKLSTVIDSESRSDGHFGEFDHEGGGDDQSCD